MTISSNKIINLLFILLMLISGYLFADVTDSLKSKLDEAKGKERISIIINLMERLERNEPEEAINFGNEALRLLDINPDKEKEIEVLYHKGWAYYQMNDLDSASYYAALTRKISEEAGFVKGLVMNSLLTARIFRTRGLYGEALKSLKAAEAKNQEAKDSQLEVKILNEFGSVYRRLSRYDEAIERHRQALDLLKEVDDEEELTGTYTYLGIMSDLKGNYDEALSYHQKALELNKKDNDARGTAASNHNIGILYQKIGKYNQAIEYYNSALQYWVESGNKNGLASTLNSIGAVNELTLNHREALKYYEQAFEIWEEIDSKYSMSIALNNIGSIHEFLGNYNEAINFLKQAIDIRQSLGDKNGTAGSMIVLSAVYNKMNIKSQQLKLQRKD